ncbi:TetR/AcrR family transcriptional regulator [Clostridium sp. 'deep sea']|uniref:TetR/AcrR family transcriptional regulator n=1 Tax=Clostridium sp. 'deep sea' TaxID=2779445 RepID=UPI001896A07D|nr:TetR/AcrR family transcriptional regulator [Clostridium sp. 'deep sea']QOR36346.1 TetR/AcrR family transcriptional regulator [Clostridium sp. 'deep sea']
MTIEKKRNAEVSIKKIIEAAQNLFAEKGFKATTLTEIGEHSGLSRTTPSYFFKNKELLYKSAVQALIADEQRFVETLNYDDEVSIPILKDLLFRHIFYTYKNPNLAKILVRESMSKNPHDWIYEYVPGTVSWSHQYLVKAQEVGIIRPDLDTFIVWLDAMAMAWLPIITQNTFFKSLNTDVFSDEFIEKQVKQMTTLLFESIISK